MAAYARRKYFDTTHNEDAEVRRREVEYWIYEVTDVDTARAILLRDSAEEEAELKRTGINGLRPVAASVFEGTVLYSPFVGGLPDATAGEFPGRESTFTFDTGGGRMQMNVSLYTPPGITDHHAPFADGPDSFGLINADIHDGVRGVEIEKSVFNFTITKTFGPNELATAYLQTLYRATACTNSLEVRMNAGGLQATFKDGELLFRGATGSQSNDTGRYVISYNFAFSEDAIGVIVPGLAPFRKRGWEYLEVRTVGETKTTIDGTKYPARKPAVAFVHQVYKTFDLNLLGV